MDTDWINIQYQKPEDGERVLTWDNYFNEPRIQVFNETYQCWDTEDGDDFEYSLNDTLSDGKTLRIEFWMKLPKKPDKNEQ